MLEKIIAWVKAHKKALLIIGLTILAVFVIVRIFHGIVGDYTDKIKKKDSEIAKTNLTIEKLKGITETQDVEKKKLLSKIIALEAKAPAVKIVPVEKVKTIEVEKVLYVPQSDYKILYEQCQFSGSLLEKYREYIKLDLPFEENLRALISHFETVRTSQADEIDLLKTYSAKLERKLKRKFSIGPMVGYGINQKIAVGAGLTYTIIRF